MQVSSNSQINELYDRIEALKKAAMLGLIAIRDVGCDRSGTVEAVAYILNRKFDTGKNMDERLEEAHDALQAVLIKENELE